MSVFLVFYHTLSFTRLYYINININQDANSSVKFIYSAVAGICTSLGIGTMQFTVGL
jgi:hypothetical protein